MKMRAIEQNNTWSVITLPVGKRTIDYKWVFTLKYNYNRSVEVYKTWLITKRFTQTYGIGYLETFAPIAKLNNVKILVSLIAMLEWPLHQLDVKVAFPNSYPEEVYMDGPLGFEDKFR